MTGMRRTDTSRFDLRSAVLRSASYRVVTAAIAAAGLIVGSAIAGCAIGSPTASPSADSSVSTGAATSIAARSGQRIVLRFDQEVVAATLADTTAGREFADLLPLTLDLRDPMGQAKSGRLPAPIDTTDATTVIDPDTGGIYYVPDRAIIAIYYDDLGHTVPPPGLVAVGFLDAGTDTDAGAHSGAGVAAVADAGNRMRVLIDLADRSSS
jgi:hypothetical protein